MMQVSLEHQHIQQHDLRQQPLPSSGLAPGNKSGASDWSASLLEETAAIWDKLLGFTAVASSAATPASAVLAGVQKGHQHLLSGFSKPKPHFEPLPSLRLGQEGSERANHTAGFRAETGVFAQLQPQMFAQSSIRSHQSSQMQSLTALNYAIVLLGCGAGVALATLYLFAKMRERDRQQQQGASFTAEIPNPFATQEDEEQ